MALYTVLGMMAIGVAAGILAGFFGVGGGLVIVPMLVLVLGYSQYAANGTSLVALLGPVGILGVIAYYQAGKIGPENIKSGLLIAVGMFFGAYCGSRLALMLPGEILRRAFCIFLVLVAVRMWMQTGK